MHGRRTTPPGSEMGYVSATDEVPHVPLVLRAGRCIVRSAMAGKAEPIGGRREYTACAGGGRFRGVAAMCVARLALGAIGSATDPQA